MMTQQQITLVGNELIATASRMAQAGGNIQAFYDDLENESRDRGGDESMPLGWVATAILNVSAEAGTPIQDAMALPPHALVA